MDAEERKIALQEKWLEFRKEAFNLKQQNNQKPDSDSGKTFLNPVIATIMVAIIGVIGNAIATYITNDNQNTLEQRKFESDLIKSSLEEKTLDNKIKSLKLLTTLHLIKDEEIKKALNGILTDTATAKDNLPTNSTPIKIVGRSFTPEAFAVYTSTLQIGAWKPRLIVLHNTVKPTLKEWHQMSGYLGMRQLAKFYGGLGWHGGPHIFVAEDSIWVMNPLTSPGIHSPSWNKTSIGVELVGDYNVDQPTGEILRNTAQAISAICKMYSLSPDSLRLHSEDPRTRKICPGRNINKNDIISRVKNQLATSASVTQ